MTERMLGRPGAPALRYWDDGCERPQSARCGAMLARMTLYGADCEAQR